ncbi:hypothetical protein TRIP_B350111 [uncultured Desulfatiglans sp.]|nr:hypothetical protein TRIP_B350111 [uncultured Desulfatiglans sp.]
MRNIPHGNLLSKGLLYFFIGLTYFNRLIFFASASDLPTLKRWSF